MASEESRAAGVIAPALTEAQFMTQVTELATLRGWSWCHWRAGGFSKGWRVPVQGPLGTGWPDLALARERRFILAELKTDRGKLSAAQEQALSILSKCVAEVYEWRPRDWSQIELVLR